MEPGLTNLSAKIFRCLLLVLLGASASAYVTHASAQQAGMDHTAHMAMTGSLPIAGGSADTGLVVDFELVDREGKLVSDEDFRGRYVLLGFGFTHCEHICPLMALNMGQVVQASPEPVIGIFVSVDTERDTPAISDDYAGHFGESMLGLGGSIEQINAAAQNFKVSYAVTKTQDAYTVQHTANVFLIDPEGALTDVFSFSTAPGEILEAIK
jgi:protein SCO1/2